MLIPAVTVTITAGKPASCEKYNKKCIQISLAHERDMKNGCI